MTTFHDQQPQSRRAVRQSERGESAETQAGFTDAPSDAPQQFSPPIGDMWDTVSRRAAQLPPVSRQEEPSAGRRAATPPAASPEPLTYSTQSRPQEPRNDGPTFRSRGTSAPLAAPFDTTAVPPADALPPTEALPNIDQPAYRVRDFKPGSDNGLANSSPWGVPAPESPSVPLTDLDYHTDARFLSAAAAAPLAPTSDVPASVAPINTTWAPTPNPSPEPAAFASALPDFPLEQTVTRREMRARQQADASGLTSQNESVPPTAVQQAAVPPTAVQPTAVAPVAQAPAATQQPVLSTQQPVLSTAASTFVPPAPASPVTSSPFESVFTPSAAAAHQRPEPVAVVPADIAPAPIVGEPSPWTPPTGHWSSQLKDDGIETTINRSVGSGSTATSALVLPAIPFGNDIRGPLTSTGEIMLTGSIDLPRNLAATGQSDRFDNGGIDELFDLSDAEVISTDSSPVRAIRAVSTHTAGHGVTHTQKPKGTRALTALLIAASSMAVVVAGLLVAAFAFNVF